MFRKFRLPQRIDRWIDKAKFDYEIRYTEYAGHATELAREAVQQGYDLVVAAGGDGSINEIANSLVGTNTALGIIPVGSGNGLARHLGIPRNVVKSIKILNQFTTDIIDSGICNGRYFFSNAGFGFDSCVAHQFRNYQIRGFLSYAWAVARQFFSDYRAQEVTVDIDEQRLVRKIYLMGIFNSNNYGFGVGMAKDASLKDGLFNIFLLKEFNRWKVLWYVVLVLIKQYHRITDAEIYLASFVKFNNTNHKKWLYQLDGDAYHTEEDIVITMKPLSLNVVVPEKLTK